MPIRSIRLQNFKGFKDAGIILKPLTVVLGPNSAGKSAFCEALVALSKVNSRTEFPNLMFDPTDPRTSVEFGTYSDLVHNGCEGEPVMIELGLPAGRLKFGFGGAKEQIPSIDNKDLELTRIEMTTDIPNVGVSEHSPTGEVSQVVPIEGVDPVPAPLQDTTILSRDRDRDWTVTGDGSSRKYKLFFKGLDIQGLAHQEGTAVSPRDILPVMPLHDLVNLLEKISYLRPDREAPRRQYLPMTSRAGSEIDDRGNGVGWYIHKYGNSRVVDVFKLPHPASDVDEARDRSREIRARSREQMSLKEALSFWLEHLGLAKSLDTNPVADGQGVQIVATPPGQSSARNLIDVGFGLSQALPILVKGLSVKEGGLFIVEQPEAQLHPRPQADLADFFCSMVKCGRNVLVETHSENVFHRLRALAALDDELFEKIAVYFIDEPQREMDGSCQCSVPRAISLAAGTEFDWPAGFLSDGVEMEMQVRAGRLATKKGENER